MTSFIDAEMRSGTSARRRVQSRLPVKSALSVALLATLAVAVSADAPKVPTFVGNGMGQVTFLRYSPNGKELVRICQFGGVELFDTERYDKMRTFEVGMRMVSFSPDGTRIATAEGVDGARVWDATLRGKQVPIPKERQVQTGMLEVSVLETPMRVLETRSSEGASSIKTRADKKRVLRAEFSPDGKRLVTAQANGHLKVWNTDTWALEVEAVLTDAEVRAAAFAPDGKSLVVGDTDGVLHEWNFEQQKEVRKRKADGAVLEIVFAPDGRSIATVHRSATGSSVKFWDENRLVVETREGWSSVGLSKDGKTMAIGGARIEFIDPSSRKPIRTVELPTITMAESNPMFAAEPEAGTKIPISVVALVFSPDGATLAAGCQDGSIRLIKTAP